jgi:uncharacterized protein (DUF58 family)
LGHFLPILYIAGKLLILCFCVILVLDFILLYLSKNKFNATRQSPERLSNGDDNKIHIYLLNQYPFPVKAEIIDEIPFQFQIRDFAIKETLATGEEKIIYYILKPVERGEYHFGKLNVYISSKLNLIIRRFKFENPGIVPVYPSFIQMRKYELMAVSNRLTEAGIKKIRRISNNNEFEQIKDYVTGDDYRTINWKATARRTKFMVNQYQDEKAQQVFSLIDMGRTMKMPFENMTLLDYAINASLVISKIAMYKQDKAGIITFSKNIHSILPADRKNNQIISILELLYKQNTNYEESNYEALYVTIKNKLKQRSLLILYTNFEGFSSAVRQLNFLKQISRHHLLVVVFFENTEVKKVIKQKAYTIEDVYIKTIAEKFSYDKKLIVKELNKYGIHTILTEPQKLTVNTINKYLELKAIGLI